MNPNNDEQELQDSLKNSQKEADTTSGLGPDPGTLHTTDPQEHMHGPVSDFLHGIEGQASKSDREDPVAHKEQEKRDEGPVRDHD